MYQIVSLGFMREMRLVMDRFGIYAQRRAMARVLPGVVIYRGDEWWN